MSDEGAEDVAESVLEERVAGEYVTFRVYLCMLRLGAGGVREVYRGAGLSSPSLALHHLEKLNGLGLVSKDERGVYHVVRRRFGVLRFFVITGKWLVPRAVYYMIFYVAMGFGLWFVLPSGMREVALVFAVIGVVTNLIESIHFYRIMPK